MDSRPPQEFTDALGGVFDVLLQIVVEPIAPERDEAVALAAQTMGLAETFGLPIVPEYDIEVQEEYNLQRSFECAAMNAAGIPALTPELGSPHISEKQYLE